MLASIHSQVLAIFYFYYMVQWEEVWFLSSGDLDANLLCQVIALKKPVCNTYLLSLRLYFFKGYTSWNKEPFTGNQK